MENLAVCVGKAIRFQSNGTSVEVMKPLLGLHMKSILLSPLVFFPSTETLEALCRRQQSLKMERP